MLTLLTRLKYFMFYMIKLHCLRRRHSENGTRNRQQRLFIKVWKDEFLNTLVELRSGSLVIHLSEHSGKYLVGFALKFFYSWIRGDLEYIHG